ncbi:MAG TPA: hypothetical protein VM432_02305 [Bdellovibrionales bacterium]|nr:hypothetical protein [Bdellovibrionales bacterium]
MKKERVARELERQQKALRDYAKAGHGAPKTRREFLASGFIAGMSTIALPSLLQLIASEARASNLSSECKALLEPQADWMPYLQVSLAGGAAVHTSILLLDKDRQLLPSYSRLGLGVTSGFSVGKEFGNVPFATFNGEYIGQIMAGLTKAAGAEALANTSMVKFCVRSQDDKINPDGLMGLVTAAGRRGMDLPNLGTPKAQIRAAYIKATGVQNVTSIDTLISSLSPQGALASHLKDPAKRGSLLKLVSNLSAGQRKTLDSTASAQSLGKLVECSSAKNIELGQTDTSSFDPRQNTAVASIWNITADSDAGEYNSEADAPDLEPTAASALHATVAYNVLNGRSGAGRIDLSGYDYHGQTREQQNAKDLAAGTVIGRILKTAHALQRPVFLHVTSDGSVESSSASMTGAFGADAGSRGSGFFLVYNPKGRITTTDSQIGHFNSAQAVDESFMNTWIVDRCALAVFANYLQLHRQTGLLDKIAPGEFDAKALAKVVKVA